MRQIAELTDDIEAILALEVESLRGAASGGLSAEDSERLGRAARTLAQLAEHRRKLADAQATHAASVPTGEALEALCADAEFRRLLLPALACSVTVEELRLLVETAKGGCAQKPA